jgi:hypothetical protein
MQQPTESITGRPAASTGRTLLVAGAVYLAWTLATYLLEGRVSLLTRPDPLGRALYAVVANILIGTALAAWALRWMIDQAAITAEQVGFRAPRRALVAAAIGIALGLGVFLLQRPRSVEPLVILNVFAQVLPTSVAEVSVCWAAVGAAAESTARAWGRAVSLAVGIAAAAVLFGVYHFAHSAPFNQPGVVVFLTLVGLGTGLVYVLGRDIYATIIIHNFLGMVGIIGSVELAAFRQPLYPLYILALVALLVLMGAHAVLIRRELTAPESASRW